MTTALNKSVMKRFVDFINTADAELGRQLVSPDAIFHVPGRPLPLRGLQGYLEIIGMMRSGFPDIQWNLEQMIAEGEAIAAMFTMRGTHKGTFFGVPATGRGISVRALNIYTLKDGLIIEEQGHPDLMGLMQQIGAINT